MKLILTGLFCGLILPYSRAVQKCNDSAIYWVDKDMYSLHQIITPRGKNSLKCLPAHGLQAYTESRVCLGIFIQSIWLMYHKLHHCVFCCLSCPRWLKGCGDCCNIRLTSETHLNFKSCEVSYIHIYRFEMLHRTGQYHCRASYKFWFWKRFGYFIGWTRFHKFELKKSIKRVSYIDFVETV